MGYFIFWLLTVCVSIGGAFILLEPADVKEASKQNADWPNPLRINVESLRAIGCEHAKFTRIEPRGPDNRTAAVVCDVGKKFVRDVTNDIYLHPAHRRICSARISDSGEVIPSCDTPTEVYFNAQKPA